MYTVVYNLGNIADWLTAFGTIGAVIVSLYFSYNRSRKKAKVIISNRKTVLSDKLLFRIVNTGIIPIEVSTSRLSIHEPWWSKKDERVIHFSDEKPMMLEQSKSRTIYIDSYTVDKKLEEYEIPNEKKIKLIYVFRDTEGAAYSKVFNYTVKKPKDIEEKMTLTLSDLKD
ncbi:hypothetical protein M3210_02955 [Oceanobacillus luteolus]|uniref:hypothetical protein n=1 Tax=Oceanobacillus luteolus TaxID=1274358 RepID=UPI00203BDA41|nr:hypothetical protein [Oceanobacillus luteolus]MCM3739222.1 hypothetical protein [Oceanobacillus luteolus]